MIALRDNPMALGPLCVAGATLVAMTTLSRLVNSFSALPTISSLPPFEYMLAVSKKLSPASIAWRISERLASSLGYPYGIAKWVQIFWARMNDSQAAQAPSGSDERSEDLFGGLIDPILWI